MSGIPDVPEELGWQELDAQAFQVGYAGLSYWKATRPTCGSPTRKEITFGSSCGFWMKMGEILGETGLIRPGEYVQSVTFDTVPAPGATISMKLMAYEPETYHFPGAVPVLNTVVQVEDG